MSGVTRTILVEVDYKQEAASPVIPVTETLHLATKEYFDDANGVVYAEAVNSIPQYSRGLQGDRLGDYRSTIGTLEIDNANGEYDYILGLALDGSQVRVYIGDTTWLRVDFRHVFTALATKASAPSFDRISISLKDTTAFLNKSLVGSSVGLSPNSPGGTGPNADRPRPINFGYVHQVEALVIDSFALLYAHSDTDTFSAAQAVRDGGLDVNYIDNGDGTFTLDQSPVNPTGGITCDVLSVMTGSPADATQRRMSDAFRYFIGDRAGLAAEGLYLGAGPTYVVGDDDDYMVGVSIAEAKNVIDLLGELADSGNCFWAITREGKFTFGRLNFNMADGSPTTTVTDIEFDDIDRGTIKVDHTSPKYYKLQAYMSKNWTKTDALAAGLEGDARAVITRDGLFAVQPDSATNDYASSPQLYSLSLTVSPVLETLLSGNDDATDVVSLQRWMERRRTMFLPWIETFSFTVRQEFYTLEIGDVVRLTMPRYGLVNGGLFQVIGVDLQLTQGRVGIQLMRRHASEFVPADFERELIETTPLVTGIKTPQLPPPTKPPEPPVVIPPIWPPPQWPGGGNPIITVTEQPVTPTQPGTDCGCTRGTHAFGQNTSLGSFGDFNRSVAMNSAGTLAIVGMANSHTDIGSSVPGQINVYEFSGTNWTYLTTLENSLDPNTALLGYTVGLADDDTIVAEEFVGGRLHVFTRTSHTTWSHQLIRNSGNTNAQSACCISKTGDVIVDIESQGDPAFYIYKRSGGTWSLQQTVTVTPDSVFTCDISADGKLIVISGGDTATPTNTNMRVYASNPTLTTWTLDAVYTPTTDNGNTRTYPGQQIAMAADKSYVAVVLPNDQDGAVAGTLVLYKKSETTNSFSQIAFFRSEVVGPGFFLGIGSACFSFDGRQMFVGEPYGINNGFPEEGRVFCVGLPGLASSGPVYLIDDYAVVQNPHHLTHNRQRFGEALACDATAERLLVASADFDNAGRHTADFFQCHDFGSP